MMKAIGINQKVGVNELTMKLKLLELAMPIPKKGELLVKVRASTINIDDIHAIEGTMMGRFRFKPLASSDKPVIPGTEFAGTVLEQGEGAVKFPVGTKVYGICSINKHHGPWATCCVVSEKNVAEIPAGIAFNEVVSYPMSATLALKCMENIDRPEHKTCLVLGASGGIGSFCVQALTQANTKVIGVCSTKNVSKVKSLGAHEVIAYDDPQFESLWQKQQGDVDYVFDFIGGLKREKRAMKLLKKGGGYLTIVGPVEWVGSKKLSFIQFMTMFCHISWKTLTSHLMSRKSYKFVAFKAPPPFAKIQTLWLNERSVAHIDSVIEFDLNQVVNAIERVLKHQTSGRIVIEMKGQ